MSVLPRAAGRLAAATAAQLGSCGPRLLCAQLQTAAAGADAGGKEPKAELPKRFYKTAHVAPAEGQARSSMTVAAPGAGTDGAPVAGNDNNLMATGMQGYQVLLDRRVLKTPAGKPLLLPSRLLALAVAAEWEQQVRHPAQSPCECCTMYLARLICKLRSALWVQEAKVIRPFTMPLMTLAATALDEVCGRTHRVTNAACAPRDATRDICSCDSLHSGRREAACISFGADASWCTHCAPLPIRRSMPASTRTCRCLISGRWHCRLPLSLAAEAAGGCGGDAAAVPAHR